MSIEIRETKDKGKTLYNPELNETYHSTHGAWSESWHVFIEHGFRHSSQIKKKSMRIFEMGFGSGLNVFQTALLSKALSIPVELETVEIEPISWDLAKHLGFEKDAEGFFGDTSELFESLHLSPWNTPWQVHQNLTCTKHLGDVRDFNFPNNSFDVVYFDAFAPNKQVELWTLDFLENMYQMLTHGGILTTYCAQGKFKRTLKELGFEVFSPFGPPGKREMTLALKK